MISIDYEDTLKKSFSSGINLFLGSGFSLLAEDATGSPLPLGGDLKTELISFFNMEDYNNLNLQHISTILEATKKDQFYKFLKKRFSIHIFDDKYSNLENISIKNIFTTNIDDLIYNIYNNSKKYYINDITHRGPSFNDREAIDFIPLHGSIIYDDKLIFSIVDTASSFRSDPDKWHFLTGKLQEYPSLFWGYNLSDADVLESISYTTIKDRTHKDKWIVLFSKDEASIQYFKALDFHIIISDTINLLNYIGKLQLEPVYKKATKITHDIFPEECLPSQGSVPVRPLKHFYLGSAPSWFDIYGGNLHKTEHHTNIINSINSQKNTIVVGLPGCGKTTLMMQVAAEIVFSGYKLICESVTKEKALLILKKLDGEKAVIFLDNFSDDIDATEILYNSSNITLVCFDREYFYDIISHRLDLIKSNVINVSELNEKDIQSIFLKIPSAIRHYNYKRPIMEEGTKPSIIEIMELNVLLPNLSIRFKSVLNQLLKEDDRLHDLLVMFCYVHSCRTPVSVDMALSFLRGDINHFSELYHIIDKLGLLLAEYSGILVDSSQDHFTPRSTIVSEAVINQVSSSDLKRILIKFHNEVSPFRICRYDIFRRRAYDKEYISRAFNIWQEGKEFYEKLYGRDDSPYLLQQGALYLAYKNQFRDAFSWIDRAILQTAGKVFSIRNSHAIILFKANINAPQTDPNVQITLKESMEILSDCYKSDKRKTYHGLVFADQALQYWDIYGNDSAFNYLEISEKWLTEENKKSAWNRDVRRLLKKVSSKLRQLKN